MPATVAGGPTFMVRSPRAIAQALGAPGQLGLTAPDSRWGLRVGAGPALIFHAGSGSSLLARSTDVGALVNVGGSLRLDPRLALTLDAHEYLFSSRFAEPYTPLMGAPLPAGSHFRREFVLLAGFSWRTH